jgi:hypothetical protein
VEKYDDPLSEAAYKLGRQKGEDFANQLIDHNVGMLTAEDVIEGYEAGDEQVMNLCPDPLSGEWSGDPTPITAMDDIASLAEAESLLEKPNIEEALDSADDVLGIYEQAFRDGFWEVALKKAHEIVEANKA